MTHKLINNWQHVCQQINLAAQQAKRTNDSVQLIAVSKTKPVDMVETLLKQGQHDFGENYLQEAIDKISTVKSTAPDTQINWHYIGHIQRNKTRDIAENFDWVHTVERDIIAKRLNEQRPDNLTPLNVLIQLNIDNEASKSGCQIEALTELVTSIKAYPKLNLRGLMIIPAKTSTDAFARTQQIFQDIANEHTDLTNWDTLSMGMSADMDEAIKYGATMVRVGTAIFGARG